MPTFVAGNSGSVRNRLPLLYRPENADGFVDPFPRSSVGNGASSEVRTWPCSNCREWTNDGAYRTGTCNHCGTPRATKGARNGR